MTSGLFKGCWVHAPKSGSQERLATAMEIARMQLPEPPRTVVVRPESAAELGRVETIEIVSRDGAHRERYLFPLADKG